MSILTHIKDFFRKSGLKLAKGMAFQDRDAIETHSATLQLSETVNQFESKFIKSDELSIQMIEDSRNTLTEVSALARIVKDLIDEENSKGKSLNLDKLLATYSHPVLLCNSWGTVIRLNALMKNIIPSDKTVVGKNIEEVIECETKLTDLDQFKRPINSLDLDVQSYIPYAEDYLTCSLRDMGGARKWLATLSSISIGSKIFVLVKFEKTH